MTDKTPYKDMTELQDKIFYYNLGIRGLDKLFEILKNEINEPIIEIGCGNGLIPENLHKKGIKEIHGTDNSSNMIEKAKQKNNSDNYFVSHLGKDFIDFSYYNTILGVHGVNQLLSPNEKNFLIDNIYKTAPEDVKIIMGCRGFWNRPYLSDYKKNNEKPPYTYERYPKIVTQNEVYSSMMVYNTWINDYTEFWDFINIDNETQKEARLRVFRYRISPNDLVKKFLERGFQLEKWQTPNDSGFYEHLLHFKRI